MTSFLASFWLAGWRPFDALPDSGAVYVQATAMTYAGHRRGAGRRGVRVPDRPPLRASASACSPTASCSCGIAFEIALLLAIVYLPPLQRIFHTQAMDPRLWLRLAIWPVLVLGARRRARPSSGAGCGRGAMTPASRRGVERTYRDACEPARACYAVVRVLASLGLRSWFRLHVWRRHVRGQGAAIMTANHKSFLDAFFIGLSTRRRVRFMAKAELFRRPFGRLHETGAPFVHTAILGTGPGGSISAFLAPVAAERKSRSTARVARCEEATGWLRSTPGSIAAALATAGLGGLLVRRQVEHARPPCLRHGQAAPAASPGGVARAATRPGSLSAASDR